MYELTIKQLNKLLEKHINESRTYVIVYSIRGTNSFEEETINSNDDIDTLMTKIWQSCVEQPFKKFIQESIEKRLLILPKQRQILIQFLKDGKFTNDVMWALPSIKWTYKENKDPSILKQDNKILLSPSPFITELYQEELDKKQQQDTGNYYFNVELFDTESNEYVQDILEITKENNGFSWYSQLTDESSPVLKSIDSCKKAYKKFMSFNGFKRIIIQAI